MVLFIPDVCSIAGRAAACGNTVAGVAPPDQQMGPESQEYARRHCIPHVPRSGGFVSASNGSVMLHGWALATFMNLQGSTACLVIVAPTAAHLLPREWAVIEAALSKQGALPGLVRPAAKMAITFSAPTEAVAFRNAAMTIVVATTLSSPDKIARMLRGQTKIFVTGSAPEHGVIALMAHLRLAQRVCG